MKNVKKSAVKAQKNVKSNVKSVEAQKDAQSVAQSVKVELDLKNSHAIRQKAKDSAQIDLFALHGESKVSKGYISALVGKFDDIVKGAKKKALLMVAGVGNWVFLDSSGRYARNDIISGGQVGDKANTLVGDTELLKALYGSSIEVMTEEEVKKAFESVKESQTRRIGGKKGQTVTGKVIREKEGRSVLLTELNGKLALFNCESERNEYNKAHRYAVLKG